MRTPEEIERQIAGLQALRAELPPESMFGTQNHAPIDACIDILKGVATYADYKDSFEEVEAMAYDCKEWLEGRFNDDLF